MSIKRSNLAKTKMVNSILHLSKVGLRQASRAKKLELLPHQMAMDNRLLESLSVLLVMVGP